MERQIQIGGLTMKSFTLAIMMCCYIQCLGCNIKQHFEDRLESWATQRLEEKKEEAKKEKEKEKRKVATTFDSVFGHWKQHSGAGEMFIGCNNKSCTHMAIIFLNKGSAIPVPCTLGDHSVADYGEGYDKGFVFREGGWPIIRRFFNVSEDNKRMKMQTTSSSGSESKVFDYDFVDDEVLPPGGGGLSKAFVEAYCKLNSGKCKLQ